MHSCLLAVSLLFSRCLSLCCFSVNADYEAEIQRLQAAQLRANAAKKQVRSGSVILPLRNLSALAVCDRTHGCVLAQDGTSQLTVVCIGGDAVVQETLGCGKCVTPLSVESEGRCSVQERERDSAAFASASKPVCVLSAAPTTDLTRAQEALLESPQHARGDTLSKSKCFPILCFGKRKAGGQRK